MFCSSTSRVGFELTMPDLPTTNLLLQMESRTERLENQVTFSKGGHVKGWASVLYICFICGNWTSNNAPT